MSFKREQRAVWISTINHLDWPSKAGLTMQQQQQEWLNIVDFCQKIKLNTIIVQIRPMADAFYPSKINPWSQFLTGIQGKNPGYDPLAFMLTEAHKRNLEFHAWLNPYRVSNNDRLQDLATNHPARLHPEWVRSYGGKLYYDPGVPEVRQHIVETVQEIVRQYEVDAIHFDDYFYPYPVEGQSFPDDQSFQQHGKDFTNRADWRRANIDRLIQEVSKSIKQINPKICFGVSPFGIWRNKSTDPAGSDTNGLQSYDELYADTRKWVQQKWLDYIAPQLYWQIGNSAADYQILANWWANVVKGLPVHLYIGQAAYRIEEWKDGEEIPKQIQLNRSLAEVQGQILFRYQNLVQNPLGFTERLQNDLFQYYALIPFMSWLSDTKPPAPYLNAVIPTTKGKQIRWQIKLDSSPLRSFVLYHFPPNQTIQLDDPRFIKTLIHNNHQTEQTYLDSKPDHDGPYIITSLTPLHRESDPSNAKK